MTTELNVLDRPISRRASVYLLHLVRHREAGLVLALAITMIIFAATAPNFTTTQNLLNVLRQSSFAGIVALAMTLVIVAGEIDISVGSLAALSSALIGIFASQWKWPLVLVVLAILAVGVVSGIFVGLLRSYLAIPSIIATLALFLAFRGAANYFTEAKPIPTDDQFFNNVVGGDVFGVPFPLILFLAIGVFTWLLAARSTLGRQIYAVGGNAIAARAAGINVPRVRVVVFAYSGLLAALVGVLLTARIGAGSSSIGQGMEFEVIAAVIIGGTALSGGIGSIIGSVLGVLFVTVLGNALVLYGVNSFAQDMARGAVVLLAVILNSVQSQAYRVRN